jgi:tRNA threonylcarbamoyladenosine biosynthesis protein TsaE
MQFQISHETLEAFADKFWNTVNGARVFAFHGQMGAGKTTIIAALCKSKGVTDAVSSPTFSIINEYSFQEEGEAKSIFHIDLYRLKDEAEVVQSGVEDCVFSGSVCLVEWPEKAPWLFDENSVHVYVSSVSEHERRVDIRFASSLI